MWDLPPHAQSNEWRGRRKRRAKRILAGRTKQYPPPAFLFKREQDQANSIYLYKALYIIILDKKTFSWSWTWRYLITSI